MISANPMGVVAVLTLAGAAVAQDEREEQRIGELIEQLKDETTRSEARAKLLEMGGQPTDMLVQTLRRDWRGGSGPSIEWEWRRAILKVLTTMGKDAVTGFSDLGDTLTRLPEKLGPQGLQTYGELAFWAMGNPDKIQAYWSPAPPYAMQLIFTTDGVRQSVGATGNHDLMEELDRTQYRLDALRQPSLSQIESMLDSGYPPEMELGLEFAEGFGPQARGSLSQMVRILKGEFVEGKPYADLMRFKAARAIVAVAPDDLLSSLAYGYLAAHHHDPEVRGHSALAAASLSGPSGDCVPYLVEALSDRNDTVVREAITALGMIGPAAKEAIPTLEKLTEHDAPQIAERAKAALRQVRGR